VEVKEMVEVGWVEEVEEMVAVVVVDCI